MAFIPSIPVSSRAVQGVSNSSISNRQQSRPFNVRAPSFSLTRTAVVRMSATESVTFPAELDGKDLRIGIVSSRWHIRHINAMVTDVCTHLSELNVSSENIVKMEVPGTFEIPMASRLMVSAQKVDAIICIGVLIEGETDHYEYIASAVSKGLMNLQLNSLVPNVFGILTCSNEAQVEERSMGAKKEAPEWAKVAVEMGVLRRSQMGGVTAGKKSVGF